jgi:hypothetical protein
MVRLTRRARKELPGELAGFLLFNFGGLELCFTVPAAEEDSLVVFRCRADSYGVSI